MDIARSRDELNKILAQWRHEKRRTGFVPTMGALHEGHLSLVKIARDNASKTIVSVYVNPTQFAPHEDFANYPREETFDLEKLEGAGADLVYLPREKELYPEGPIADMEPGPAADGLESIFRPNFFNGVLSVVARLFDHVEPTVAVFGEKDYQQLCVVREMAREMYPHLQIMAGPTLRDAEGLALSSRNAYLSQTELKIAQRLGPTLMELAETLRNNPGEAYDLVPSGVQRLREAGFDTIDYVELREENNLRPATKLGGPARLLAAVRIGKTRLIDNVAVSK